MADLRIRAAMVRKMAEKQIARVTGAKKKAAQSQQVFCIVDESGVLDFAGQSQIASVPVYETAEDAQMELDNFGDESMAGYTIKEATLTFAGSPAAGGMAPMASSEKQADSPAMGVYETGLKRYPEFTPLVNKIVSTVIREINAEARKIQSEMPYKAQFTLEEVIRELEERV